MSSSFMPWNFFLNPAYPFGHQKRKQKTIVSLQELNKLKKLGKTDGLKGIFL